MEEEYRKRIASFLSNYTDINDCRYGYGHDKVIKQSIKALINSGYFTMKELQREALKKEGIVITYKFIDECLK